MYPSKETIKRVLLQGSYISEADSKAADNASDDTVGYIDYLIREEVLSKSLLGQALAEQYKIPFADLHAYSVSKDNLAAIPEDVAHKQRVVFVKASDGVAAIATDTPEKVELAQLAPLFPDKKIRLAYTLPEYVEELLGQYDKPLATRFSEIIAAGKRVAPEIVDEIIKDALSYKASDIHFEPHGEEVAVRFRVDGNLHEAGRLARSFYENILNRVKVQSGMRIDEHLAPQDGALQYQVDNARADLRVSLVPTVGGEKVVMRVLGSYVQSYTLSDIGLAQAQRAALEAAAARPFGMILVVGPTGSGKTTTLYSLLKLLNRPNVNLTTIEDPVEYKIAGVNQIQVREASGLSFAKGLRSIVRQDPDVILVGEIRDTDTAEIAVNAALTGHLLLSTFHANDAATAAPRLIDLGIEPFLLASTLEVVVAQRLVRRICAVCRYSVPAKEVLASMPVLDQTVKQLFKSNDNLYTGKGCATCNNTGFDGRTALFEFVRVTPRMQELIMTSPSVHEIAALARNQGDGTMFEDGIAKVKSGQTTLAELLRVVDAPRTERRE